MRYFILFFAGLALFSCNQSETKISQQESETKLPNIIYILTDDLGYGDVSSNNPESKINTVNIDQLASEGMRFTDAHKSSSVITLQILVNGT